MLIIVFFIILNIKNQSNPKCRAKRYQCSKDVLKNNECVYVEDEQEKWIYLQVCPIGKYCPYQEAKYKKNVVCKDIITDSKKLPSQKCKDFKECYSQKCEDGVCVGKESGALCAEHHDCEPGLHCSQDNYCIPQVKFDLSCRSNYDCENNLVCNLNKCQFYYSLENGIESNNSEACESGYIVDGKCEKSLKSKFHGQPCTTDKDCEYINDKNEIKGHGICTCGFNAGSFSYCPLTTGDIEFKNMKFSLMFILARNSKCHTLLRFGPCDSLVNEEYLDFNKKKTLYEKAPVVIMNDDCVGRIINWDYWKFYLTKKTEIFIFFNFLLIFII